MKLTVFINTIHQEAGRTTISASNGRLGGPPLLEFTVPAIEPVGRYRIGQQISLTLEFGE